MPAQADAGSPRRGRAVIPLAAILTDIAGTATRADFGQRTQAGDLYPDVPPCLRLWASIGLRLAVFSHDPVIAQKHLFAQSAHGDLARLFQGFFDTRVGGKREPDSYGRLAIGLGLPTAEVLFLSAVEADLDAAAAAGMRTCQLVRPMDGTLATERHAVASDFRAVGQLMELPIPA